MLVRALDTYEKRKLKDKELNRIPKAGEEFEVSEERLNVLLGNNNYNAVFVEVVENSKEKVTEEEVQAVAQAIVNIAEEEQKDVTEIIDEIIEESKDEDNTFNTETEDKSAKKIKK